MSKSPFAVRFSHVVTRLSVFVSMTLMLCGCLTSKLDNTDTELVVGVEKDNLPFYAADKSVTQGLDAELAVKLGERMGQPVRFKTMRADRLPAAVDAGQIDIIMNGMTVTSKSSSRVSFARPYLKTGQILVVREGDADQFKPATSIRGSQHVIGVVRNSLGESYARAYCPASVIVTLSNREKALNKLVKADVDVVIMDGLHAMELCRTIPGVTPIVEPLITTDIAWAVDPVNFTLLDTINAAQKAWLADGTLDAAIQKWIPRYGEFGFEK